MYETGEDAVRREVKEETGLAVDGVRYLFSIMNLYTYSGFDVHTLDLVYRCDVANTNVLKAEDDVAKLEFIKISDLEPQKFGLDSVREIIKKIQKGSVI